MTIYLYVKTHRKTGLKYLGQTKQDPYEYHGSGVYWKLHLNKHGYDYNTEVLHECQDKNELKRLGLHYSKLWNVVESKEWANLKEEQGDGGRQSKEVRERISKAGKGRIPWNKGIEMWDEENRKRISEHNRNRQAKLPDGRSLPRGKQSPETIAKRAASNTGKKRDKIAIENLTIARRKRAKTEVVSDDTKEKMSKSAKARGFNGYGFEKGHVSHNSNHVRIINADTNIITEAHSLRAWCKEHNESYGSAWKAFKENGKFKSYIKLQNKSN